MERNILIPQQSDLDEFSRYFLLVFTGDYRKASDVLQEQAQRNQNGDNNTFLDDMLDLAFQARALLQKGSILSSYSDRAQLGKMLQESWNLKRRLSSKISGGDIDKIIERGLELRAHGAKLLGAGGSGFVLFHAEHSVIQQLKFEFGSDRYIEFCFTNEKSKVIKI